MASAPHVNLKSFSTVSFNMDNSTLDRATPVSNKRRPPGTVLNRQATLEATRSLLDQVVDIVQSSGMSEENLERLKEKVMMCKDLIENQEENRGSSKVHVRALVDKVPATYSLPFIPLSARRKSSAALTLGLQVPAFVTHQPSNETLSSIPPFSQAPWDHLARRIGREWDMDIFQVHEQTNNHSLVAIGECALAPILLSKSSRQNSRPVPSDDNRCARPGATNLTFLTTSIQGHTPRLRRLTACAGSDIRDPILNKELQLRADVSLAMPETLRQLVACLECNYCDVPYHSSIHAAQVAHHALCLAKRLHVWKLFPRAERAALIVAALAHDVGHCARTNRFLQHTSHRLTLVYNDSHVFENFHSAMLFTILEDNRNNVFHRCRQGEWDRVRRLIISAIISTDLQDHFETIARFRARRLTLEFDPISLASDRRELSCMILKTADLSYLTLTWELTQLWTSRVYEEFWSQGDEETALGLPVSPLCNRKDKDSPKYWKDNASFCTGLVQPLLKELSDLYSTYCVNLSNYGVTHGEVLDSLEHKAHFVSKSDNETRTTGENAESQLRRRRSVLLPISTNEAKRYYENREFRSEIRKITNKLHFVSNDNSVKPLPISVSGEVLRELNARQPPQNYLDVLLGVKASAAASKRVDTSSIAEASSEVMRLANPDSSNDLADNYYDDYLTNDDDMSMAGDDGRIGGLSQNENASFSDRERTHSKSNLFSSASCQISRKDNLMLSAQIAVPPGPITVFCSERLKQTAQRCMINYSS